MEGVVLDAARELLLARGFSHFTIAAVAEIAGVGKGTIYLRWPDKESLVVSALAGIGAPAAAADTGTVRGDLVAIMRDVIGRMNGEPGALMAAVVAEIPRHPELHRLFVQNVAPWNDVIFPVIARGVKRGEIRTGIDRRVVAEALMGPVLSRGIIMREKMPRTVAEKIVDTVIGGIAAR